MPFSRGLTAAALLVPIALVAVAVARRLDRERRLIARLEAHRLGDGRCALPVAALSPAECETAADLAAAGVLIGDGGLQRLDGAALAVFQRRRRRRAVSAAIGALALATLLAAAVLAR